MDAETSALARALAYVRPRARIVGGAFVVGLGVGVVLFLALAALGLRSLRAARTAFLLGTLAFGGGVLGWSGSAMAGRGFEAMQEHLETGTNWTEADSRRAMARIGGFGAGVMTVTAVVEFGVLAT